MFKYSCLFTFYFIKGNRLNFINHARQVTAKSHLFKLFPIVLLVLSGCAQIPEPKKEYANVTGEARTKVLTSLTDWEMKGQIAFIQQKKRERASIFWQAKPHAQSLNLTTYLGINVLSLESTRGIHTLEVDGKTYHSDNLDQLIWQLTGLKFPSKALPLWMKALPFSSNDQIELNAETGLPMSLSSFYNGRIWQINYKNYQRFNGIDMPTSLTVKQDGLTIKLAINQWAI